MHSIHGHSAFICSEVLLLWLQVWIKQQRDQTMRGRVFPWLNIQRLAAVCCSSSDKFCGNFVREATFPWHFPLPEHITWMWRDFIKSKLWSLSFTTLGPPVTFVPLFCFPLTTQSPINSGRPWGYPHARCSGGWEQRSAEVNQPVKYPERDFPWRLHETPGTRGCCFQSRRRFVRNSRNLIVPDEKLTRFPQRPIRWKQHETRG